MGQTKTPPHSHIYATKTVPARDVPNLGFSILYEFLLFLFNAGGGSCKNTDVYVITTVPLFVPINMPYPGRENSPHCAAEQP